MPSVLQRALSAAASAAAKARANMPGPRGGDHADPWAAGRQMCFDQGKPFVYSRDESCAVLVTEWPNGVVDTHEVAEGVVTRRWPDGRELRTPCVDPDANGGRARPGLGAPEL